MTDDGESLGVMDTRDAIQEARKRALDLVEIAPNAQPPVAKIIDYGKFLYEQKKKAHEDVSAYCSLFLISFLER